VTLGVRVTAGAIGSVIELRAPRTGRVHSVFTHAVNLELGEQMWTVVAPGGHDADLRLVLLAAMASTWIFSLINRNWPSPALASGFVLTVWGIMLLGWLNSRFNPAAEPSKPEPS
jgi:hypothetical protein